MIFSSLGAFASYSLHYYILNHGDSIKAETRQKEMVMKISLIVCYTFVWYTISISFTIYNKWFMNELYGGFAFPLFNTSIHMIMKFVLSRLWFRHYTQTNEINLNFMNNSTIWRILVLIGVSTSADIALSNESLVYISITMYTTIKATVLVFTFLWTISLGLEQFSWELMGSVSAIVIGVGIAILSSVELNFFGIILCAFASAIAGCRWSLLQLLLRLDKQLSQNSILVLYCFALYSVVSILPTMMLLEMPKLYSSPFASEPFILFQCLIISFFGGLLAFGLIVVEVTLVKLTSSLTMSVLGQVKEVTQIGLSMLIFHDKLSLRGMIGIIIALCSAQYYRHIKMKEAANRLEQYEEEGVKITDHEDVGLLGGSLRKIQDNMIQELDVFEDDAMSKSNEEEEAGDLDEDDLTEYASL
jgi:solute carrier family 35 protein C2